ncbi:unnamed protein product [Amoebophrya sp. A25]|nr:unnamed protein product [Amoebophrya sp. A25]|eukprot:GSA25T00013360001.1
MEVQPGEQQPPAHGPPADQAAEDEAARKKARRAKLDAALTIMVLEHEAVRLIGGEQAAGLTQLAQEISNKIRELGHQVDEDIEILVPKSSQDGKHRKMILENVPRDLYALALDVILPHVIFAAQRKKNANGEVEFVTLKDERRPGQIYDENTDAAGSSEQGLSEWDRNELGLQQTGKGRAMKVLTVSVDKIGLLIGRGGSKVREIQESTGAEVLIEPTDYRSEPPVTRVRVTGEEGKVAKAVTILEEILAWAAAHPREEAGKKMEVSLHHVPKLLKLSATEYNQEHNLYAQSKISSNHTGAENLKTLEEESGAEIEIDQTTGNLGYSTILIRGEERAMAKAVDIITKDYIYKSDNSHLFVDMGAEWMVHPSKWRRHIEARANAPHPPPVIAPPGVGVKGKGKIFDPMIGKGKGKPAGKDPLGKGLPPSALAIPAEMAGKKGPIGKDFGGGLKGPYDFIPPPDKGFFAGKKGKFFGKKDPFGKGEFDISGFGKMEFAGKPAYGPAFPPPPAGAIPKGLAFPGKGFALDPFAAGKFGAPQPADISPASGQAAPSEAPTAYA